jgi:hypothetical protein
MTKRPTKVQAPDGCGINFTPGKIYNVIGYCGDWDEIYGWGLNIIADDGNERTGICERKTFHLNGKDWIVIKRESFLNKIIRKIKNYNL